MRIIAVDDEYHARKLLERAINKALPNSGVQTFENAAESLAYAKEVLVDIAFLDIEMAELDGLQLAKELISTNNKMNIIYVTGHAHYAIPAFELHASGYLLKPVAAQDITREIENLRYPLPRETPNIHIKTFGGFDVYVNDEPVLFSRNKAKEVLAILVDHRGMGLSMKELAGFIWEEGLYTRSRQQQIQTFISTMMADLKKVNADHIIVRKHNFIALNKACVDCDLYRFMEDNRSTQTDYVGNYLPNYSWGEPTAALLENYHHERSDLGN